jgi:hypothetical protein
VLVEHLADPLGHAAADLPLDDIGVDDPAAVLDHDVPLEPDLSGGGIDLDDAGVCAPDQPLPVIPSPEKVSNASRCESASGGRVWGAVSARPASLASGSAFSGTPLGTTWPSITSRSSTEISSIPAAMASTFSFSRRVVTMTAPLAHVPARLPPVPIML